ncbi:hypothetical protein GA0115240_11441, partial [Streptomyces sp. DvalAA-14]
MVPPGVRTVTVTGPAGPEGAVAVSWVSESAVRRRGCFREDGGGAGQVG